jgi:hypothetical protein
MRTGMNEGCSACACGVPGACDKLYLPGFLVPGIVVLVVALVILLVLARKRKIKIQPKMLIIGWLIVALAFAGLVALKTETAGDITRRAAERCRISNNPVCEY